MPVATIHLYWVSESAAPAYRMRSKLASINSLCFLHGTLTSLLTPLCTFFCGVHVRTSQGDPGHVVRMVYTSNVSKQRWSRNAGDKTQILWTPTSSALDTTEHSARLLDAVEDDALLNCPFPHWHLSNLIYADMPAKPVALRIHSKADLWGCSAGWRTRHRTDDRHAWSGPKRGYYHDFDRGSVDLNLVCKLRFANVVRAERTRRRAARTPPPLSACIPKNDLLKSTRTTVDILPSLPT